MSKEYQLFQKECEELNKARSNQINDLEKTISEVRQKYTKQNTEITIYQEKCYSNQSILK